MAEKIELEYVLYRTLQMDVYVVQGGLGKTTLIRRLMDTYAKSNAVYIIFENDDQLCEELERCCRNQSIKAIFIEGRAVSLPIDLERRVIRINMPPKSYPF